MNFPKLPNLRSLLQQTRKPAQLVGYRQSVERFWFRFLVCVGIGLVSVISLSLSLWLVTPLDLNEIEAPIAEEKVKEDTGEYDVQQAEAVLQILEGRKK